MRQRPDVRVTLRPGAPRGGDTLDADIVLHATSTTPVDGIDVRLTSRESVPVGKTALTHVHLVLEKKFEGRELAPGDHLFKVRFALPGWLLPSYDGAAGGFAALRPTTSIAHLLDVHVRIPWWLDRYASFAVRVRPAAVTASGRSRVYATFPAGPRGAELGIELSLQSDVVARGEALVGAVALVNVAAHRVRALRLELVAFERLRERVAPLGVPQEREVERFAMVLREEAPAEGESTPFVFPVPRSARTSLAGAFFSHGWRLEAIAEIALGRDVTLGAPIRVVPDAGAVAPALHAEAPPIGHERRARVWASVAESTGLGLDAEREHLRGDVGSLTVEITLERARDVSRLVAHLAYPPLGLALDAHSRGWTEVLRLGEVDLGDEAFSQRVTARGRFDEQLRALFGPDVRAALVAFDEVHLEDDGAALASDSGGSDGSALNDFVTAALLTARELDVAIARVGAPPPLAHAAAAWRAFAARTEARFSPGGMTLHGARIQGKSLDVLTLWEGDRPMGTRVVLAIARSVGADPDVADGGLSPEARGLIDALGRDGVVVRIGPSELEGKLDATVDDPSWLEERMERVAQLAQVLRAGPSVGPYR